MQRLHKVRCLCGHEFIVDLGPRWKPGLVLKCPKCKTVLGKSEKVTPSKWTVENGVESC